jgi:hypothetical protein
MVQGTVIERLRRRRDQVGATTAEYAVCTGAGVGFAGVLFKFLASDTGQHLITNIFDKVMSILPF